MGISYLIALSVLSSSILAICFWDFDSNRAILNSLSTWQLEPRLTGLCTGYLVLGAVVGLWLSVRRAERVTEPLEVPSALSDAIGGRTTGESSGDAKSSGGNMLN
jgi:hypothetical protein